MKPNRVQPTINDIHNDMVYGVVRIIDIDGDKAWVESESQSACAGCATSKGCGTKLITGYFGKKVIPLHMENNFSGSIGDRLEVGLESMTLLKASALIYLMPIIGLVAGAIIGSILTETDLSIAVSSITGMALGFSLAKYLFESSKFSNAIKPVFMKKLEAV